MGSGQSHHGCLGMRSMHMVTMIWVLLRVAGMVFSWEGVWSAEECHVVRLGLRELLLIQLRYGCEV